MEDEMPLPMRHKQKCAWNALKVMKENTMLEQQNDKNIYKSCSSNSENYYRRKKHWYYLISETFTESVAMLEKFIFKHT